MCSSEKKSLLRKWDIMNMNKHAKRSILGTVIKPMSLLILLLSAHAYAVQGGAVAQGAGTIAQQGATTNVNQSSDKLVVNWKNFDIGTGERVNIQQPNANSAILNRVQSNDPTMIQGMLNANGRVFIVNPNGIVASKGASINANSVVLSAADVSDSDFMAGRSLTFSNGSGKAGTVRNDGTIFTQTGAVLIGAQAINGAGGSITVAGAQDAELASGNKVTMTLNPDGSMNSVVVNTAADGGVATNEGQISLQNGNAYTLDALQSQLVRNTATIEAQDLAALLPQSTAPVSTSVRGSEVAAGTAQITQDGKATNVAQQSDKLVVNWNDFDTASDESINFAQPNANSAVLNRVQSGKLTSFDGTLNANGRVYVLNPDGIVVGQGATINANSVTLAAADVSDDDFLTKRALTLKTDPNAGGVVQNLGTITTKSGTALVGKQVLNLASGRITSYGNIGLAAGDSATLALNDNGSLASVQVNGATAGALVANDGRVTADGGSVSLLAQATGSSNADVVRNRGQINAINRGDAIIGQNGYGPGGILIDGSNEGGGGNVSLRGRLIGDTLALNSTGILSLYGSAVLSPKYGLTLQAPSVKIGGLTPATGDSGVTAQ
jgi:filamentous hemagglutinin family protein